MSLLSLLHQQWINQHIHFEFLILHYPRIKLDVSFFISLKDKSYVDIGSTMCIRTTLWKFNAGGYSSDSSIKIQMHPFVLISFICGFRKNRQRMEYIKKPMDWWPSYQCFTMGMKCLQLQTEIGVYFKRIKNVKVLYVLYQSRAATLAVAAPPTPHLFLTSPFLFAIVSNIILLCIWCAFLH